MSRKIITALVLFVFLCGIFPLARANDSQQTVSPVFMEYYQGVKARLDKEFDKLSQGKNFPKGLRVKIFCGADAKGHVLNPTIKKPSGHEEFDQLMLSLLQHLKKLPKPPREIADEVVSEGFLFEFNSNKI